MLNHDCGGCVWMAAKSAGLWAGLSSCPAGLRRVSTKLLSSSRIWYVISWRCSALDDFFDVNFMRFTWVYMIYHMIYIYIYIYTVYIYIYIWSTDSWIDGIFTTGGARAVSVRREIGKENRQTQTWTLIDIHSTGITFFFFFQLSQIWFFCQETWRWNRSPIWSRLPFSSLWLVRVPRSTQRPLSQCPEARNVLISLGPFGELKPFGATTHWLFFTSPYPSMSFSWRADKKMFVSQVRGSKGSWI